MINIFIYFIQLIIAGYISKMIYPLYWWAPAILIPVISYKNLPIPMSEKLKFVLNTVNMVISISYIGLQAYLFYINLGWYGAIIGLIIGYFGVPFIVHEIWRK